MNINEFRTDLIDYLMENYAFNGIKECDILKNNGVKLCGINIDDGNSNVLLTIYLEKYFDSFVHGQKLESIAKSIIVHYEEEHHNGQFNVDGFRDFSCVKENLYIKLINTEANHMLLEDVISRPFLDLSMVVYFDASSICGLDASILIKKEHIKMWEQEDFAVLDIAYENTRKKAVTITEISEIIKDCSMICEEGPKDQMYVMQSKELLFSASLMTFDDRLDEFIGDGRGVYIIPSSIYEVLLIRDNEGFDYTGLNDIISSVNTEALDRTEVLSSHAYYYCMDDGYSIV